MSNWADPPFDAPVELFRDRVLRPTLEEIKKRRLTQQIDYIVYSSGFPYAINFTTDLGERVMSDNRSPAVGVDHGADLSLPVHDEQGRSLPQQEFKRLRSQRC